MEFYGEQSNEDDSSSYDSDEEREKLTIQPILSDFVAEWIPVKPKNELFEGIHGHSTVRYKDFLYLFGGARHGWSLNKLYRFDLSIHRWEEINPKVIDPVGGTVIVSSDHIAINFRSKMLIFGGRGHAGKRDGKNYGIKQPIYDSLFEFDFETEEWRTLQPRGDIPSPRKAMCHIVYENRWYIFGGWNNVTHFDDMFYLELDSEPKNWVRVEQKGDIPHKRQGHSAVLYKDKMLLWGGTGGFDQYDRLLHFDELYEFDLKTHTWALKIQEDIYKKQFYRKMPKATESHSLILVNNKMFVFGGHNGYDFFNDLFEYDIEKNEWRRISYREDSVIPALRACSTMELIEESTGQVILIGGYGPIPGARHHDNDPWYRFNDIYTIYLPDK